MGTNDFDLNDPRVQLEVAKERLKYTDEKFFQQGRELEKALLNLGRQEAELKRVLEDRNDLKTELELTRQKLKYAEEARIQFNQQTTKKNTTAKVQAFLASLLFLSASVLASFGTNLLTSTPSNSLGWIMISIGIVVYFIAALMTTLLALGGNN